jgi:hypothetical protein
LPDYPLKWITAAQKKMADESETFFGKWSAMQKWFDTDE